MRTIRLKDDAAPVLGLGIEDAEFATPAEMEMLDDVKSDIDEGHEEIERASMEAATLLKRISALEDIAQVIDEQVDQARPSDVVLVDIATDLATEGTDIEGDDVTPGLESALGQQISSEGIKETAGKFINAVKDRMSRMVNELRKIFSAYKTLVRAHKRTLKDLAEKVEGAEYSKEATITLGKRIRHLTIAAKAPKSGAEFNNALKSVRKDLDTVEKYFIDIGHDFSTKIVAAFTLAKSPDNLTAEIAQVVREFTPKFTAAPSHGEGKWDDGRPVKFLTDFGYLRQMNGWAEIAKLVNAKADDRNLVEAAYEHGCFEGAVTDDFVQTFGKIVKQGGEASIPAGTKAELNAILKTALDVVTKIEQLLPKFERGLDAAGHVHKKYESFSWVASTRANRNIGVVCLINGSMAPDRALHSAFSSVDTALLYVTKSLAAHKGSQA